MAKRKPLAESLAQLPFFDKAAKSLYPIFETHCHLDYLKQASFSEVAAQANNIGVEKIMTIAVSPDNLDKVLAIAQAEEHVYCSQGVHPHDARLYDETTRALILSNLKDKNVRAVGEIGLDYHYDHSPRNVQRERFEEQLEIACDHNYPVIIHTRDADEDTLSILKNMLGKLKKGGVIHSYTSGKRLAEYAIDQGLFIAFNGIITFKSAENVREILALTPLSQILLETDSPFLTPVPYRGLENAPCYLPFVANTLLEIKQTTAELALPLIYENSLKLFNLEPADENI